MVLPVTYVFMCCPPEVTPGHCGGVVVTKYNPTKKLHATYAAWSSCFRELFGLGLVFLVRVQLHGEHGLFQLAAALGFQAGFVGLPGQIEGEAALAEHSGDAGAGGAHGGISGFVSGPGGAEFAQGHLKQLAALKVGLKGQVVVVPDKGGLVAGLRGHGAHRDHSLVTIDAGAPGGQVVDIPRHDELDDAVQTAAQAQIVGEIVQGIVDHGSVLFRVGQKLL